MAQPTKSGIWWVGPHNVLARRVAENFQGIQFSQIDILKFFAEAILAAHGLFVPLATPNERKILQSLIFAVLGQSTKTIKIVCLENLPPYDITF